MSRAENLSGKTFGKLTVVDISDSNKWGKAQWICHCECGNSAVVSARNLKSGNTKSCGCLVRRGGVPAHGTHNWYANRKCRCDLCKESHRLYEKEKRIKLLSNSGHIPDHFHGTCTGYRKYKCRCESCKHYAEKEREKRRPPSLPKQPKHGTLLEYTKGCRCNLCAGAKKEYGRQQAQKIKNDVIWNLSHRLRSRLNSAIKGNAKSGSAVRDLGCSIEEFKKHLESQFSDGMSWGNYGIGMGQWSIDHIIPLNTFDLSDRDQLLFACHYTNMRPLWHIDNMKRPRDGSDLIVGT